MLALGYCMGPDRTPSSHGSFTENVKTGTSTPPPQLPWPGAAEREKFYFVVRN